MFTHHRPNDPQEVKSLNHAQRVIGAVMKDLSQHPQWRNPLERVSVRAAVDRCVSFMIRAGETDDDVMKDRVLKIVMRSSQ